MLKDKIKKYFKVRLILPILVIVILVSEIAFGSILVYQSEKGPGNIRSQKVTAELLKEARELNGDPSVSIDEEIKKKPPKYSSSGSTKKISTPAGEATAISTGGDISGADADKLADYADDGPSITISYNDTTGRYPSLGTTLINYLYNSLLSSSSERAYMYQIEIIDCSSCNYGGLYTGSYISSGSDITKAFGWIKLNSYWYKDSAYFEDYMKLILSHEYGHHYSLYHRWVDLDIPAGDRWPASYYSNRPLSLATTAVDYSLGWGNCDTEVVAEDYSYFYSDYGQHAMNGSYGLPSSAINSWFYSLSSQTPGDSVAPTVSITSPANGATVSGSVTFSANASDNQGVTRVEFIVDSSVVYTDSTSPYSYSWGSASVANGSHTLKAKAYDSYQGAETSITVTVNNVGVDSENPSVVINQPAANPYNWSASDLIVEATGSDNVAVTKIEFYINGVLAATDNDNNIIRLWEYAPTPPGSYTLGAKAYDAAGNTGEASIVVNKS